MLKAINHILGICSLACLACSDHEELVIPSLYVPEPEEEPVPVTDTDFEFAVNKVALLDLTGRMAENETTERNLYSAGYMLEVAGMPCFTTDSWSEAMAGSSLILVSSPVGNGAMTADEAEQIATWLNEGGILVAPGITATDAAICQLFGISSAVRNKMRYYIRFTQGCEDLSYVDEPEELEIRLGTVEEGTMYTWGYGISGGTVLAQFETGEAAMVCNPVGQGKTYTVGVKWRDIIQRSQLNKDFGANRATTNAIDCMADVFSLAMRSIYVSGQKVGVWKHTVPGSYLSVLLPTHDCDSRTAYEEMYHMSDYEKSLGVKAHYFLTVHYYRDKSYLSAFYDSEAIAASRLLIEAGHTVGSHSIGHFPDFSKTERFPLRETTEEEYSRTAIHDVETGITSGGST